MIVPTISFRSLLFVYLLVICLTGCSFRSAFGLASFSEEGAMLKQEISPSTRFAVVVKQEDYGDMFPEDRLGESVANSIAKEIGIIFGAKANALQHTADSSWYQVLTKSSEDRNEFYRTQGYDVYVEVVLKPEGVPYDGPTIGSILRERYSSDMENELYKAANPDNSDVVNIAYFYQHYGPVYRLWKVHANGEIQRLVAGGTSHFQCPLNIAGCSDKFGKDFRQLIEGRLKVASE